jgi:hypothetical protein
MGITPITNLTPLSFARSIQADLDPLPMERVENSARTGDETYSPSGGDSARGSEDDVSEEDVFEEDTFAGGLGEAGDESGNAGIVESSKFDPSRPISFFA